ncbi:xanthine dehydrogenase molybdopterin binding subunit [Glaciecola petra]|uniref:Xanthine dehydrogenase molybdopterin binding subunit n=1 Tax=Glaciecola petra TaxID=3075602 RepID=A0ABU2ZU65_9ALTE|nr:xanthine dehydrogenase molybdopterin binding subunit [Aestuariibacter sp. P117]MDT0596178.1 xanthine dehydrogenase molybdopterin binding subunit [Aestuariibacter sp. P117]
MRKLIEARDSKQLPSDHIVSTKVKNTPHESAVRQVSGTARYVDDIPEPANLQHAAVGMSEVASGKLVNIDLSAVWQSEGVCDVILAKDVPGHIDIGPVFKGDPLLADGEIKFYGQAVFAVLAKTVQQARVAATKAKIEIQQTPSILTIKSAKKQNAYVRPPHFMKRGDTKTALQDSEHILTGSLTVGGQEHLYLEGQVSMVMPEEEDRMLVFSSSQHPSEVQKLVAEVLGIKLHKVVVDMRRMGGGFGGKETQAAQWSCIAALLAARNRCAVKLRLPRQQDMIITGKRHPFENEFTVGFNAQGKISATDINLQGNCGHSPDLSDAIVDRAMFHADNAYYYPHCEISGHRMQTNQVSHTAYRGFGGPQGMIVAEAILDAVARKVGLDPLTVRKQNLYSDFTGDMTPYHMQVHDNILPEIIAKLEESSDYWLRREKIKQFNEGSPVIKKGLALTPVKFGISFTAKHLNQAGALVHVYTDGSIQANHGGTEMGQGLHTKISQIVATEFGVSIDEVDITSTRTDKVPNTSPTAASSGTDLNGKAVQNACISIKKRLAEFFAKKVHGQAEDVVFMNNKLQLGEHAISWFEVVQQAYFDRISLSANGFYKTPKIHYDRETGQGRPFFYFAYGASVSEVSIDTLTGEYKLDRVDILHDVGASINPAIDKGQIEGGFIQGMGWLTTEELLWQDQGRLISNNLATYKIPAIGDTPKIFNVDLFEQANIENSIYHSKAVGEPPFMLAISVWCAIKDAISSLSEGKIDPPLSCPATPEKVLRCVIEMQNELDGGVKCK